MKKKLLDQSKLLKVKESSVQKVSKLMQEIQVTTDSLTWLDKYEHVQMNHSIWVGEPLTSVEWVFFACPHADGQYLIFVAQ